MTAVSEETRTDSGNAISNLAALVLEHQADVWRYLRFQGAARQEADDLTQETFLAVACRPFDQRSRAETAAYLRTVARNQLLMLRRKQQRQISTVELESAESVWAKITGQEGSLDHYMDALEVCLEQIEGRARKALDLQYRLGASRGAIATELNMKPDGVKTLLRRTRQLLRDCIQRRLSPNH